MSSHSLFWPLNIVGGIAVLGSYLLGFVNHRSEMAGMWGGVESSWRPIYGISMLAAAFGYLAMVSYVQRNGSQFSKGTWIAIYVSLLMILLPSALWMSTTLLYIANPSATGWLMVKLVLLMVAAGGLALLATIWRSSTAVSGGSLWAVVGLLLFAFHTTVLDGIIWTAKFPQLH